MSDKVTHDEIDSLLSHLSIIPRGVAITEVERQAIQRYVARNRERDEKDVARAKTLKEFRYSAIQKWYAIGVQNATEGKTQLVKLLDWIPDNFPQLEPKSSDLDRLAAALSSSNKASSRPDCICLIAKGTVGLMKWDGMAGRFAVPDRGMSVDEMLARLEKPKPVTRDRVNDIFTELNEFSHCVTIVDLLEELRRFVEQKEGESDE